MELTKKWKNLGDAISDHERRYCDLFRYLWNATKNHANSEDYNKIFGLVFLLENIIFKPELKRAIEFLKLKLNARMLDRLIDETENPDFFWDPRGKVDYLVYLENEDFSEISLNVIVKTIYWA